MRAKTIMTLSTVAIPAQYLESRRIPLCPKPSVESTPPITTTSGVFSMFRAIPIHMVNSKKQNILLTTTSTYSAVMGNDFLFSPNRTLLFKLMHIFSVIVSPVFLMLTIFKNLFWRKMLSPIADVIYTRLTLFAIFHWWSLPTSGAQSSIYKLLSPLRPSLFEVVCVLLYHRPMIQHSYPHVKYLGKEVWAASSAT